MPGKKTKAALIIGGGAVAVGGTVAALPLVGFTAAGVAAGTMAAGWQAGIGNVLAGSLFSALQSAGVAGLAGITKAGIAAVGAGFGLGIGKLFDRSK